jgi:hypothetical protein
MNKNNEIVVSNNRYGEASIKFRDAWNEYQEKESLVKYEIVNMVKILEKDEGMNRTQAIQKIINDHKDLPGFSRRSISRTSNRYEETRSEKGVERIREK